MVVHPAAESHLRWRFPEGTLKKTKQQLLMFSLSPHFIWYIQVYTATNVKLDIISPSL